MKYALGNMLNGAGGLNADGLSLDLQFATDKTLTARKGPTPVFVRASGATQVGAAGLIEYAPENLFLQSETFATSWTINGATVSSDVTTAPNGLATADKLVANSGVSNAIAAQSFTLAGLHTMSVYAKAAEWSWIAVMPLGANTGVWFDLSNGTVGAQRSGYVGSISSVGDGWYRCSVVFTGSSTTATARIVSTNMNGFTFSTGDGTSGIFIWGAQLERFSSARDYIPTTTAAIYGPRFDHDPVTLACKGLLIEESRTNQILQSENFGTTWTLTNATASLNVATAPDGSTNADKIINTIGGVQGRAQQNFTLSGSNVYSVFAKANEWSWVYIAPLQATGGVWFNLTNGTIGTQQAGFVGSITSFGNGWYRCAVQCTGLSTPLTARIHPTNADAVFTLGDGTSGILLWGAQLEAGSFPTSYIPTTTASVIRSADVCSITGASSTFGNTDGTLFTVGAALFISSTQSNNICSIDSGTTGQLRIFNRAALDGRLSAMVSNVIRTPAANYNTAGVFYKAAITANASGADYVIDGTQIPDTYTGSSIIADNLKITGVGGTTTNSWISSIRYYKKRLSVAKLQTLTT